MPDYQFFDLPNYEDVTPSALPSGTGLIRTALVETNFGGGSSVIRRTPQVLQSAVNINTASASTSQLLANQAGKIAYLQSIIISASIAGLYQIQNIGGGTVPVFLLANTPLLLINLNPLWQGVVSTDINILNNSGSASLITSCLLGFFN